MIICATAWLAWLSFEDMRKKKISSIVLLLGCLFLWTWRWLGNNENMLRHFVLFVVAMLPGLLLICLAGLSEQVGMGDGIAVTILGPVAGSSRIWSTLYAGLFFMALFSCILLACRKINKASRVPFLPFLLAGWIATLMLTGGISA